MNSSADSGFTSGTTRHARHNATTQSPPRDGSIAPANAAVTNHGVPPPRLVVGPSAGVAPLPRHAPRAGCHGLGLKNAPQPAQPVTWHEGGCRRDSCTQAHGGAWRLPHAGAVATPRPAHQRPPAAAAATHAAGQGSGSSVGRSGLTARRQQHYRGRQHHSEQRSSSGQHPQRGGFQRRRRRAVAAAAHRTPAATTADCHRLAAKLAQARARRRRVCNRARRGAVVRRPSTADSAALPTRARQLTASCTHKKQSAARSH